MPNISFLDIVNYLENLADNHNDVASKFRWNFGEISNAIRNDISYPVMLIDSVEVNLEGNTKSRFHKHQCAFTILAKPNNPHSYEDQNNVLNQCQKICFEICKRIIHDGEQYEINDEKNWLYGLVDISSFTFQKGGPLFSDGLYGYRCEFAIKNQISTVIDEDIWSDLNQQIIRFLDTYPNADGESWAIHQLNSDFSGDVVELMREDSATMFAAFVNGELPYTSALNSFAGSSDVRIKGLKGQANGMWATQSSLGAMPYLYKAGVLQTKSGQPTMKFEGAQELLPESSFNFSNGVSSLTMCSMGSNDEIAAMVEGENTSKTLSIGSTINTGHAGIRGFSSTKTLSYVYDVNVLLSAILTPTTVVAGYMDGEEMTGESGLRSSGGKHSIGSRLGAFFINGTIQEHHVFLSQQNDDITAMAAKILERYVV